MLSHGMARRALEGPNEPSMLYLSISRPCQGGTLWGFSLAVCADHFLSQLIHNDLALQILYEQQKPSMKMSRVMKGLLTGLT